MELIRQPVYLLLLTASAAMILFVAGIPYFGLGDDPKLVKDGSLAIMLTSGLFAAVLSASSSLAREIRNGTALAVLSKPVGRTSFLMAKFCGLAGALLVMTGINLIAALQASRMVFDSYSGTDWTALFLFYGAMLLAYIVAGLINYFAEKPFVQTAVLLLTGLTSVAFFVTVAFTEHKLSATEMASVEWRLIPAGVLILFAVLILAGLALLCTTRLDLAPTLAICSVFFLGGLMSDFLFGQAAADGVVWAKIVYAIMPNWQLYWVADALDGESMIPLSYLFRGFVQMALNLGAILALSLLFFEERELS